MLNKTIEKTEILVPKVISYDIIDEFNGRIMQIISQRPDSLEINCSEIEHVTSSHVNLIWQAHSSCHLAGIQACLSNPSDLLINVLKVLDLSDEIMNCDGSKLMVSSHSKSVAIESDKLSLSVSLNSKGINQALKRFRSFLGQVSLPKNSAIELETVFYETITNVRMHSGLSTEKELQFVATTSKNTIEMTFTDIGVEFDPTKAKIDFDPATAIKDQCRHGLGLVMISRMSGKLCYYRSEDGRNVFVIEKSWG